MRDDNTNADDRGSECNDLLGPLPEPQDMVASRLIPATDGPFGPLFTASQMRAYAAEKVAAERERWRVLLSDVSKQTRHPDYDWPACLQREVGEALKAQRSNEGLCFTQPKRADRGTP